MSTYQDTAAAFQTLARAGTLPTVDGPADLYCATPPQPDGW